MSIEFNKKEIKYFMQECIGLADKTPWSMRMPHVGALVVSNKGEIISRGYKRFLGGTDHTTLHAERDAINNASFDTKGNCLVTTLEPCYRHKSRGMLFDCCSDLIINSGIKKVIYGVKDNSPTVHNGYGIRYLKAHGIEMLNFDEFNDIIIEKFMSTSHRKINYPQTELQGFPSFRSYVHS